MRVSQPLLKRAFEFGACIFRGVSTGGEPYATDELLNLRFPAYENNVKTSFLW